MSQLSGLTGRIQQSLRSNPVKRLSVSASTNGVAATSITALPPMLLALYPAKINAAIQGRFEFTLQDILWDERAKQAILASPNFLDKLAEGLDAAMEVLEPSGVRAIIDTEKEVLIFLADDANKRAAGLGKAAAPPVISPPVQVKEAVAPQDEVLWKGNAELLVDSIFQWLEKQKIEELPPVILKRSELANELGFDGVEVNDLFKDGWKGAEDLVLNSYSDRRQYDRVIEKMVEKKWLRKDLVKDVVRLISSVLDGRKKRENWAAIIDILGTVAATDDLPKLNECVDQYKEAGEKELEDAANLAIVQVSKRNNDKETLKNQLYYYEARVALGELATKEDLLYILQMLRSDKWWLRETALFMLKKIGTRQDIVKIIKRLKNDDNDFVRKAAAEALGAVVSRDDIELIKKLAASEVYYDRLAAAKAFERIVEREDLEYLLNIIARYSVSNEDFYPALKKIVERGDLEFDEIDRYINMSFSGGKSDRIMFYLEVFAERFATKDDLEFIAKLRSKKERDDLIFWGVKAQLRLLTEFDIRDLFQYLKDVEDAKPKAGDKEKKAVRLEQRLARAAEERFAQLATDDEIPEIVALLNSRVKSQQRAALLAVSKEDSFLMVPPGLKILLGELIDDNKKIVPSLLNVLVRFLSEEGL
ncbi:MAG: HEAT repeat domain-containing protein [Candidatus Saganbacteria bacterium]|nr:HEAT repeat domain-containing protein [Candidatus Saganbacteria bacterium]